jgi:hypothetical protein
VASPLPDTSILESTAAYSLSFLSHDGAVEIIKNNLCISGTPQFGEKQEACQRNPAGSSDASLAR